MDEVREELVENLQKITEGDRPALRRYLGIERMQELTKEFNTNMKKASEEALERWFQENCRKADALSQD